MSNQIAVKPKTKEMVQIYSAVLGVSMSECIEKCVNHCIELGEVERGLMSNNQELKNLYDKNFGDKGKAYLELLKMQKDLELRVRNLEYFRKEIEQAV